MKTGRDLDALIADKVFGHAVVKTTWGKQKQYSQLSIGEPSYYDDCGATTLSNPVPDYSTSIESAWEVVEKLKMTVYAPGASFANGEYGNGIEGWSAEVGTDEAYGCERVYDCATAPLAICLAALAAIDKLKEWV